MKLVDLIEKFKDEKDCLKYILKTKYNGKLSCPSCNGKMIKLKHRLEYQCLNNHCNKQKSIIQGTIFEGTKTSLKKWFLAISLIINSKRGITAKQLMEEIGTTYKTAWRILNRVRKIMNQQNFVNTVNQHPKHPQQIYFQKGTTVEVDETYVGGRAKGPRGRGAKQKVIVVGAYDRQSKEIVAEIIQKADGKTLEDFIQRHIDKSCTIMTDTYTGYNGLRKIGYKHYKVNHSIGQYVIQGNGNVGSSGNTSGGSGTTTIIGGLAQIQTIIQGQGQSQQIQQQQQQQGRQLNQNQSKQSQGTLNQQVNQIGLGIKALPMLEIKQTNGNQTIISQTTQSSSPVIPPVIPISIITPTITGNYGYNGLIHTNNIEGFWNQLKRMIKGVYGTIGKKTLQSYVDEYIFRYNNRNNKKLMFEEIIKRC